MSDLRIAPPVVPPREYLQECLERLDMTQAELSRRASITKKHVHDLLAGGASFTPDTSAKLERATGRSASFWLQMEAAWQAAQLRKASDSQLAAWVDWARTFPLSALADRGYLPAKTPSKRVVSALLDFLGVASPEAFGDVWETKTLAYRRGHDGDGSKNAVIAWLRLGEVEAHSVQCEPFDRKRLTQSLPSVTALTREALNDGWRQARDLLRRCGVALVLVEEFKPLTKINGAANWVTPDKVVVEVSSRTQRADVLWFNVLHELGHVLNDPKGVIEVGTAEQQSSSDAEEAANRFAQRQLIPKAVEPALRSVYSRQQVIEFARHHEVAADIVAGRLLNDGQLKYEHAWPTKLLRRYDVRRSQSGLSEPLER
jgi:addiction module HigA family antidote